MKLLKQGLRDVAAIALSTFEGISAAIGGGDLKLAGEIAVSGLRLVWEEFFHFISVAWAGLKWAVRDVWDDFRFGVLKAAENIKAAFQQAFAVLKALAINTLNQLAARVLASLVAPAKALQKLHPGNKTFNAALADVEKIMYAFSGTGMADPTADIASIEEKRLAMEKKITALEEERRKSREKGLLDEVKAADDRLARFKAEHAALVALAKDRSQAAGGGLGC